MMKKGGHHWREPLPRSVVGPFAVTRFMRGEYLTGWAQRKRQKSRPSGAPVSATFSSCHESPLPRNPSALFPVPEDEDPRYGSLHYGSRWSPETSPQPRGGT